MLKKILSYGFFEGFSKGLNKLTILILPLFLSTIGYGKIGLLISIEMVIPLISLLGLERAVLRFYNDKVDFVNFSSTVSKTIIYTHALLLILISSLYFLGWKMFFGLNVFPDLFLVIILIYFQGDILITFNKLRVEERHNEYFSGRLFFQVIKLLLVVAFIYLIGNYQGYLYGAIIAAFLTSLFFRTKISSFVKTGKKFSRETFTTLFTFSWPFIFHGVAANLLGNADKFILEKYINLSQVGQYTLAYSYGSIMIFAFVGISVFLEPLIYKEDVSSKRELLLNKFLFFTLISGLIVYLLIAMSTEYLLPMIYNTSYHNVFSYIPLIAISYLVYPYYLKSNYKMIYEKKSMTIAVTSVSSAILNISLNIIFIPLYGIYAAVFTTLICYILQSILFVFISNRYRLNKELLEVLILSIALIIIVYCNLNLYWSTVVIIPFLFYNYFYKIKVQ